MLIIQENKILACTPKAASLLGFPASEVFNREPDYFLDGLDKEKLKNLSATVPTNNLIHLNIKSKEWSIQSTPARVNLVKLGKDELFLLNFSIAGQNEPNQEMEQKMYELRSVYHGTLTALNRVIEIKDPYNARHHQRVSDLARAIATVMKLPRETIEAVRVSASIHDIGKLMVPAEIIAKPGQLNQNEQNLMRLHPEAGHDILKTISFPWPVADIVLQHHERWDGSGYPQGLCGHQILLEARIIAVADVVEAIVSHRPYRPALSLQEAFNELEENKGILYDTQVAEACLFLFQHIGYSFEHKNWLPNLFSYLRSSS
ncbi:MAG: HD-GYP domain-containing protein [Candidatus Aminicenantes bacterium]|nr:HD-GYP domain-containing protein [Candidatus Aminicenantes bacterium]